jgi:hypothetical protein
MAMVIYLRVDIALSCIAGVGKIERACVRECCATSGLAHAAVAVQQAGAQRPVRNIKTLPPNVVPHISLPQELLY